MRDASDVILRTSALESFLYIIYATHSILVGVAKSARRVYNMRTKIYMLIDIP